MLRSLADGKLIDFANAQAAKLRYGMNDILAREGVAWKVYGKHSDWKLFYGADAPPRDGDDQDVSAVPWRQLDGKFPKQSRALRQALRIEGNELPSSKGVL